MDKATRNIIQRATQDARRLLEIEFSEQLEGTFDILPSGQISDAPGTHLDDAQRLTRIKLVAAIEHKHAGGMKPDETVAAYLREAAFTCLNRFVALKMLEARELVQECISHGENSSGFKEFTGLAPGLAQLPDHGYRIYIECLFDEIGTEVGVLFDRRDPASLLWPQRQALTDLLDTLNADNLANVWDQDETIGWVYQYFNSQQERRTMRDASQTPRNSRELAVRNQFFTPRYVVQFLTDNTLGRTWCEMRKGKTGLARQCEYLVSRPNEVFLAGGEKVPKQDVPEDLPQEELHQLPVYIMHRPKKDPRDIKIIDPACGSGHFLLYAFDLLITIYEEGWADDNAPTSEATGKTLREDYADSDALYRDMPGLILRHNLHGIDIDVRCAQIAALALWMRAQRAFSDSDLSRADRPTIRKTNIVVAESMPGEKEMLQEFTATLNPPLLGQFVEVIFEKMTLAGEAGSLLKIEEEIADAIAKARKKWVAGPEGLQLKLFHEQPKRQQMLDFSGIDDDTFWTEVEGRIYGSLQDYAGQAASNRTFSLRLFADDAQQGFAFIDLCRQRYDVALMNPPFGSPPKQLSEYIGHTYPSSKTDILCAFVERVSTFLVPHGMQGAITNRTPLYTSKSLSWRRQFLLGQDVSTLYLLGDLGHGVLDSALVEAVAYCISKGQRKDTIPALNVTQVVDKDHELSRQVKSGDYCTTSPIILGSIPQSRISYWLPTDAAVTYTMLPSLADAVDSVDKGMSTTDDDRFIRAFYEVQQKEGKSAHWIGYAKGGEYSPFAADIHLVVNWCEGGREIAALVVQKYPYLKGNPDWVLHPETHHGYPGLTYTKRTTSSFSARILPSGCRVSDLANLVFDNSPDHLLSVMAVLSTAPFQFLLEATLPSIDSSAGGTAARHYEVGALREAPVPTEESTEHSDVGVTLWRASLSRYLGDETTTLFIPPQYSTYRSIADLAASLYAQRESLCLEAIKQHKETESQLFDAYGMRESTRMDADDYLGPHPLDLPNPKMRELTPLQDAYELPMKAITDMLVAEYGGKRRFSKQTWIADRRLELVSYVSNESPLRAVEERQNRGLLPDGTLAEESARCLSFLVGVVFGRWDIRKVLSDANPARHEDPFYTPIGWSHAMLYPKQKCKTNAVPENYPINILTHGVAVDDLGHEADIVGYVVEAAQTIWPEDSDSLLEEAIDATSGNGKSMELREWLRKVFFADHISRYSKSRRKAPVYWELATPSHSYAIWLYYHRFTKDTFYKVLNDYVKPKLAHEQGKLTGLAQECGLDPSSSQRKELAAQEAFVEELKTYAEEVERIAPLWNPDLNDGVIINCAPLWRLVPQHKPWQKDCKKCWDKLVAEDYDWAHLAMHLWPERVVPKCQTDRSLAIAHGLEEQLWESYEDEKGKEQWRPREDIDQVAIDQLIAERTNPTVKAALQSLLDAPAPSGGTGSRGRRRRQS